MNAALHHKLSAHNAQTARFKADQRLTFTHLNSHGSIAGPDGCDVCGNTVVVRGYDCWACETAHNAPVRNTVDLASVIGRALELQMDAERGQ